MTWSGCGALSGGRRVPLEELLGSSSLMTTVAAGSAALWGTEAAAILLAPFA